MMKSRVLITGIAGFTGNYLASCLLERGYEVWGLDRSELSGPSSSSVNMRYADICSPEETDRVLEECRPDAVYHLAAQSSVGLSWQEPAMTMKVNVEGTINLLETMYNLQLSTRILLIGSGEEYGPVDSLDPINEEKLPNPQNPYSMSKYLQTMVGMKYFRNYGMNIFFARPFNHTGPGQNRGFVVPDFASQVAAIEAGFQETVIRVGNLSAQRDFSDVRDVVQAYWQIVEQGKPGTIYNVGAGKAISIQTILDQLLSLSSKAIKVETDPNKLRPVDVPVIYSSISKLHKEIGWQPHIELQDTIKDTLEYWRNEIKKGINKQI